MPKRLNKSWLIIILFLSFFVFKPAFASQYDQTEGSHVLTTFGNPSSPYSFGTSNQFFLNNIDSNLQLKSVTLAVQFNNHDSTSDCGVDSHVGLTLIILPGYDSAELYSQTKNNIESFTSVANVTFDNINHAGLTSYLIYWSVNQSGGSGCKGTISMLSGANDNGYVGKWQGDYYDDYPNGPHGWPNYYPYVLFDFTTAGAPIAVCTTGSLSESPPVSDIPTYSYQANGLVQFHFNATGNWYNNQLTYRFYDRYCNYGGQSTYGVAWANNFPYDTPDFTLRAVEVSPNSYNFQATNTDTGEIVQIGSLPSNFGAESILSVGFLYYTGYPGYSTYNEISVFTPAVPVTNPSLHPAKTPVLIIPGITGTELYNGEDWVWLDALDLVHDNGSYLLNNLVLDENGNSVNQISIGSVVKEIVFDIPILGISKQIADIFKSLVDELENKNYVEDQTIFYFPYDWRLDLEETKVKLNQKIEAIKLQTGSSKVDIIAHSMGGLVTKSYLDTYGKSSIRKLIFVGTPHLGSPQAGKTILEGSNYNIPWLKPSVFEYLASNFPSVYELLPNPTYFSQYQGYIRPYGFLTDKPLFDYQQTKDFLINEKQKNSLLFQKAEDFWAKNLHDLDFSGIDTYNITGCGNVTEAAYVYAFGNNSIGQIGYTSGDKTVPMISADYINIPVDHEYYVKKAVHSELPSTSGVRELILGILSGNIDSLASNVSNNTSFCRFKGKSLSWFSPVEVHIYDNGGNHSGPIENNGIENSIPGVGYEVIGHNKFIFLPTDEGEQYRIQALGQEQGTFDLRISDIDNGQILNTSVFNDVPVNASSTISLALSATSSDNSLELNLNGSGATETVEADATLNLEQSQDLVPPVTTANVQGTTGENGWYKSNVTIELSAIDDNSGILETKYSLDNGNTFSIYTAPFTLATEGVSKIVFYSVDKAGNNEEPQNLEIKIDKTPPELQVQYSLEKKDFVSQASDNLDPNPKLECTINQCQIKDLAGHITLVKFVENKLSFLQQLSLKKVTYNGQSYNLDENQFLVNYNSKLGIFNQTVFLKKQEILRISYDKKKNISTILEWTKAQKLKTSKVTGIKYIQILTNKNNLNINIK